MQGDSTLDVLVMNRAPGAEEEQQKEREQQKIVNRARQARNSDTSFYNNVNYLYTSQLAFAGPQHSILG